MKEKKTDKEKLAARQYFPFFRTAFATTIGLPNDYKLALWEGMLRYNFEGVEPTFSKDMPFAQGIWDGIKIALDKPLQAYLNGKEGGAPLRNKNAKKNKDTAEAATGETAPAFVPPDWQTVALYCTDNSLKVDAVEFLQHYEERGWIDKKGLQITDWQAACRAWDKKAREKQSKQVDTPEPPKRSDALEPPRFNPNY